MPLLFETEPPVQPAAPNRMDVACFVGFVRPRGGTSSAIQRWLAEQGWLPSASGLRMPYARSSAATLLDIPIPIESWAVFDRLFAWDQREVEGGGARATTYLGAAVRSFFAEGGRRCYVVRAGDDWPVPGGVTAESDAALAITRFERLQAVLPGFPGALASLPADRTSWHGVGHIFGLPDVSFVCCPDLPDIVRAASVPPDVRVTLTLGQEQFLECTDPEPIEDDDPAHRYHAPRCGELEYAVWQQAVEIARDALVACRCETQLIATIPLPIAGSTAERSLHELIGGSFLAERGAGRSPRVSSYVQLVFPWVTTRGSRGLPEGLEPAEGVFTGVLARNALVRGTFRSAAGLPLATVDDTLPVLPQEELVLPTVARERARSSPPLVERVSLLGRTPRGMQVLSDVTSSRSDTFRPAGLHRLMSAIVRTARRVGEDAAFEPSGEALWAGVRARIEQVLVALWRDGALRGASPAEAFDVRCDRSTMTQADLDAGRAVAVVRIDPAAPIERITVVLALDAAGITSLAPAGIADAFAGVGVEAA